MQGMLDRQDVASAIVLQAVVHCFKRIQAALIHRHESQQHQEAEQIATLHDIYHRSDLFAKVTIPLVLKVSTLVIPCQESNHL